MTSKHYILLLSGCLLLSASAEASVDKLLPRPQHLEMHAGKCSTIRLKPEGLYLQDELKDLLWQELNRETKHRTESIIQQSIDVTSLTFDDDDDLPSFDEEDEDFEEEWDDEDGDLEFDWDDVEIEAEDATEE